ncbi:MAG: hypothetical protein JSV09_16075 [Thermoplasmata archaeon]|nr:MAG: hypothetical protein JSV09_16075 [Thermoplasmata archaeon]
MQKLKTELIILGLVLIAFSCFTLTAPGYWTDEEQSYTLGPGAYSTTRSYEISENERLILEFELITGNVNVSLIDMNNFDFTTRSINISLNENHRRTSLTRENEGESDREYIVWYSLIDDGEVNVHVLIQKERFFFNIPIGIILAVFGIAVLFLTYWSYKKNKKKY